MKRCIQEYDRKLNMHYARFKFEPRIMTYYKEKKGLNISSKILWGGGVVNWLWILFYHRAEGNFDKSKRGADWENMVSLIYQLWITTSIPCWIGFWLNDEAKVLSHMVMIPSSLPSFPNSSRSVRVIVGLHGVSQYKTFLQKRKYSSWQLDFRDSKSVTHKQAGGLQQC